MHFSVVCSLKIKQGDWTPISWNNYHQWSLAGTWHRVCIAMIVCNTMYPQTL